MSHRSDSVLADGRERLRECHLQRVRDEVEEEFAERLASASWYALPWLRWKMSVIVKRRLAKIAASDSVY